MQGLSLLLPILFVFYHGTVTGNPLPNEGRTHDFITRRDSRLFPPNSKNWSFHYAWALPPLPSFSSVSSLFSDEEDEMVVLKKRVKILEKSQQEMLEYLRTIGLAMKPGCQQNLPQGQPIHQLSNEPESEPSATLAPVKNSATEDKVEAVLEDGVQSVVPVEQGEKTQASLSGEQADKGETGPVGSEGKRGTVEGLGNTAEGSSETPEASQQAEASVEKTEEEKLHGTKETSELPSEAEESGIPQASLFNEEGSKPLENNGGKPGDKVHELEVHEPEPEKNVEAADSSTAVKIDNARPEETEGIGAILVFTE